MASNKTDQQINTDEEEDFLSAMELVNSAALPKVLKVAIELNLFEVIAKAGSDAQLSPRHIVSHLPTQNPNAPVMLDRVLRLLATYNILTSSVVNHTNGSAERVYGLAPVCKYFVQNRNGVSISPLMLVSLDKVFMDSWDYLKDAILEGGIPFNMVHGMHAFQYPGTDPRFNQLFNNGMFSHTTIVMKKILEVYKGFENVNELIDVGGGIGTTIGIITSKYPKMKATNFDLPNVVLNAPSYPGVVHVGGDMFRSIPSSETIFMKWILHDWSDQKCLDLLKNCYKALPDDGKLIIVEAILPVEVETSTAAKGLCQMDITMMTLNPGGKERTEEDFVSLARESCFTGMKKICRVFNHWVMEFHKAG